MKEEYIIGIDIGGTHFRIGAVTGAHHVKCFRKVKADTVLVTDDVLADLKRYLADYMSLPELKGNVRAIAIGFPATVDRARKVVLQAPNLSYMENLPVVDYLQEHLGIPVFIERDVCMTLFYDMHTYQIPECEILAGCYFGTGIGNAICINGKPLLGRDGAAGELGHIAVPGSQEKCGCGLVGCMENLAGGKYLSRLCREVYTHTEIGDIFTEHGEEQLLRDFVDRIAITVAAEINILNPDYMIVGGGVINMKDFPKDLLVEKIHEHTRKPYPEQSLNLLLAEDEEMKSVIGAALYAEKKVFSSLGQVEQR